jgi:hypothetical protein
MQWHAMTDKPGIQKSMDNNIIYNKYIYKVRDLKHPYRYNPIVDH